MTDPSDSRGEQEPGDSVPEEFGFYLDDETWMRKVGTYVGGVPPQAIAEDAAENEPAEPGTPALDATRREADGPHTPGSSPAITPGNPPHSRSLWSRIRRLWRS